MSTSSAGVLPPVDTWHPQVWRWVHAAWEQAGGLEAGKLSLAQLVRALWSSGDPWSRAYRDLFAGAPAPGRRLAVATPDEEVFYSGEPDLVEVMEQAARAGAGRIHPWSLLMLIAERTQGSAQKGRPGWTGVRAAPVEAVGEGTLVRAQRGAALEEVMDWAGGRQVVAIILDERLSSSAERFATPYVEGHFSLLADDRWVLREPADNAPFWVLEGVAPDAAANLEEAIRQARRRVPGFVPWLPLRAGVDAPGADAISRVLTPLRTLPRLVLTTDPDAEIGPSQADSLVVALDRLTGGAEESAVAPVMADHPHREDVLGHEGLAASLSATLGEDGTEPPLVMAVLGPSGSGRTDLLRRLQAHWVALRPPPSEVDPDGPPPLRAVRIDSRRPLFEAVSTELLGRTLPAASPAPPPGPPPVSAHALAALCLPGAESAAPRAARRLARAGLACGLLGAAGTVAASGHWAALLPATVLGLGAVLTARGIGQGLLAPDPDAAVPLPTPSVEDRLWATELGPRLLVLLDDLDRVDLETARERLAELPDLLAHPALPPLVVVLACRPETLADAACAEHPPESLVQVPLWLPPLRPRAVSRALSAWTGLPAPPVPQNAPTLRAVSTDALELPPPVPIHVEADEVGEIGPADLAALVQVAELVPPTPRCWKALVNQVRLLRPHLGPAVTSRSVATWLALAAADREWVHAVRAHLHPDEDTAALIRGLAPPPLTRAVHEIPPDFWPEAADLLTAADDVLRWTLAGPYAEPVPEVIAEPQRATGS